MWRGLQAESKRLESNYQSLFLWRLALVRLRRLCLFIFKRRFFLRLPILLIMFVYKNWKKTRVIDEDDTGHKTGNNLLSHSSEAALPSATEGLTSVFGMETCVSPRLWSPEWFRRVDIQKIWSVATTLVNENISLTFGEQASLRKIRRFWWNQMFRNISIS